jgi:hypothetical protein
MKIYINHATRMHGFCWKQHNLANIIMPEGSIEVIDDMDLTVPENPLATLIRTTFFPSGFGRARMTLK